MTAALISALILAHAWHGLPPLEPPTASRTEIETVVLEGPT